MRLRILLVCCAALVVLAVAGGAGAVPSGGCVTTAGQTTCTFSYTGAAESWTVPAGVTSVMFDVQGAQGGGDDGSFGPCLSLLAPGGKGGEAKGTFAVTPGSTLQVNVGGFGDSCTASGRQGSGFNGGGGAGAFGGFGGGGASDIRTGSYTLADRIIVGGGGGGATADTRSIAGAGGGTSGGDGTGAQGGKGGTQSGGGAGGTQCFSLIPNGGDGSLGTGGGGVGGGSSVSFGGGGGGGGYYGGGGGSIAFGSTCQAGSGGGGSGFVAISATNVSQTSGVREGNGQVTITYATPVGDQLSALYNAVKNTPPGKALGDKVKQIQAYVAANNKASACAGLNDFINLVKAQKGKKLTNAQAADYTAQANAIKTTLGC